MKIPFLLALASTFLVAGAVPAHAAPKIPVYVECSAKDDDQVGKDLCSTLKDLVATSPVVSLIPGPGKRFHLVLLVGSAGTPISSDRVTASSVVFGTAIGEEPMRYLGHEALVTGAKKVGEVAVGILVDLVLAAYPNGI